MVQSKEDTRSQPKVIIHTLILAFTTVLSLTGNSLVCLAVYKNRRLRTITNFYVLSLAVADLFTAMFGYSFTAIASGLREWPFGFSFCTFQGFLLYVWSLVSTNILALTAVNRYFCIVKPKYYPALFTKTKTIFSIIFMWLFTFSSCLTANIVASVSYQWDSHFIFCQVTGIEIEAEKVLSFAIGSVFIALPMCIIFFCYSRVYCTIKRHNSAVIPSLREENNRLTAHAHEVQVSRVLFAAVFAFWICWIPVTTVHILLRVAEVSVPSFWLSFSTLALGCSLWINAIIYGIMNRAMRKEFQRLLRCPKEN